MNIIVIADDLTGANDTGVQFLKEGFPVEVFLTAKMKTLPKKNRVSIVNTESRALPSKDAYRKVLKVAEDIDINSFDFVYKKIDSTMRGNIATEIDALLDYGDFDAAIVAPSYPENGRTVIGGYHLINGELLENTEIAQDPKTPVTESYLPNLIGSHTDYPVGHIEERFIRGNDLDDHLQSELANGKKIIVIDSSTNDDLDRLAAELTRIPKRFLWVGSAALAQSLSKLISLSAGEPIEMKIEKDHEQEVVAPILTIAGSVSGITKAQVNFLQRQGFQILALEPIRLLSDEFTEEAVQIVSEVIERLKSGEEIVITTKQSDSDMDALKSWLSTQQMTLQQAGTQIADRLGFIGATIVRSIKLKGLVLTGGDIAFATCSKLDLDGLTIIKEVEEGIPLCEVSEGQFTHLKVVTKAGAFGKESSLHYAVQTMQST